MSEITVVGLASQIVSAEVVAALPSIDGGNLDSRWAAGNTSAAAPVSHCNTKERERYKRATNTKTYVCTYLSCPWIRCATTRVACGPPEVSDAQWVTYVDHFSMPTEQAGWSGRRGHHRFDQTAF